MTEGNPTVEEAREDVIGSMSALFMQIKFGGYRGQTVPTLPEIYVEAVDDLIEAVRQEERERIGSARQEDWDRVAAIQEAPFFVDPQL